MGTPNEGYGDTIFSHVDDNEYERLQALSDTLDPVTLSVLESLPSGVGPQWLELGAGTGSVARWMAERHPSAHVTGTDRSLRLLDSRGHDNLWFICHDVTQDSFPDSSWDLIHTRYLLHHLPERDHVHAAITRWLSPGGWLVLEEPALFPLHSARDDTYRRVSLGALEVLAQRLGTDCTDCALNLPAKSASLGLTDIDMHVTCPTITHGTAAGTFWRLTLEHLKPGIAELPYVREDEVADVIDRLSQPGLLDLGMATITVTARKPRSDE
ncbi:Methyltransferase domain-containing protein [Actinopolyspora lacussalsi subsp. righensis]|uniref:Methyltransferase domain-containing protein n=1 Tax=Actinopolyspora righensis TaxID=995060 RepID=A0A1I6XYZ0_9ACTN|nr:methyltransferase domain-containing protein [Actinopolyspora righensis]SFT43347.1 Methyltransferase domain-containing protein [Actinopolyspora righensis]